MALFLLILGSKKDSCAIPSQKNDDSEQDGNKGIVFNVCRF